MKLSFFRLLMTAGVIAVSTTGCVRTIYTKTIQVKRDAEDKVIETVEIESVSQPGVQPRHVQFEHLKATKSGDEVVQPK